MANVLQKAAAQALPLMPKAMVARVARNYVAGASFESAAVVAERLTRESRVTTLDVLGEEHVEPAQVELVVEQYLEILRRSESLPGPPTLSLRMTALGLRIDPSLPWGHLQRLAGAAADRGRELTIDMEDSSTVDATLDHYRRLRASGFDNVGIVLQSCLRRSLADLDALSELAPRVRIVKGIWIEPAHVAHADFEVIRARYVRLLERLLECGSYVEIATHDEWLIDQALAAIERHGRQPGEYEFQMLLGVREELGDLLVADGHPLRIYLPFGEDWYGYCLRRLRENPEVAKHVTADVVSRIRRRTSRKEP